MRRARWRRFFLLLLLCLPPAARAEAEAENIPLLVNAELQAWEYQKFNDIAETDYTVNTDDSGRRVLSADSRGGASGYTREQTIALYETPWLHIRWRVRRADANAAEKTRAGDDYALRLYFVGRSGMQYRALNLVYAQTLAAGEKWKSPYSGFLRDIRMYVLAAHDAEQLGEWQHSVINVGELWREAFADDGEVGAVGIMTDGDNLGIEMQAEYGDIVLSASADSLDN